MVQGFQSFPRLACRFTWCLDFRDEPSCKTARFLNAHFIDNTTVRCTTDSYIPLDVDCSELVIDSQLFVYADILIACTKELLLLKLDNNIRVCL